MHSKTKIIVLHMKELIYTGIFLLLAILFLVLLFLMFFRGDDQTGDDNSAAAVSYVPGVYTTALQLGENTVEIEVVLDEDHINSVRLVNLSEAVTTMYPLIEPAFDSIVSQIYDGQSLDQITYSDDNRYTSAVLLQAIRTTLDKAEVTAADADADGI
jgi:uncharacterized protein with FMN-binding domain